MTKLSATVPADSIRTPVLKMKKEVISNQVGKTTTTPTLRSIFQLFQDIALVHISGHDSVVTNMSPLREKILGFFPLPVRQIYGYGAPTAHSCRKTDLRSEGCRI